MEDDFSDDNMTPEEYLKNLDLQDFLNCHETKEILESENYYDFELIIKPALERLFQKYAKNFNCDFFLKNDPDGKKNSDIFSEIIFDNMSDKFDLNIFYDCPILAKKLLT
tara:strand:+ start:908 stop:1237 length:330 start_codon:yes stop_codon:yes gene_type:complete